MQRQILGAAAIGAAVVFAACGGGPTPAVAASTSSVTSSATGSSTSTSASGSSESNPTGDIPDSQAFVAFTPASGAFTVKVPEGWARTESGGATTFTDKLNSIRVEVVAAPSAPTTQSASAGEVPAIAAKEPGYQPGKVSTVQRQAGSAVLITYQADSAPDPVTGKVVHDEVERYEFWRNGTEAILTLSGPKGADNVDPWKTVTDSFGWAP